jgi:predicted O-methyltransferase YrrM
LRIGLRAFERRKASSLRHAYEVTRGVHGWLKEEEGILLWYLARSGSGRGAVVEIGSWKGKSPIWLACASKSKRRERIVAIDPHTGSKEHLQSYGKVSTYDDFLRNLRLAGVIDWVIPIIKTSREVAQDWMGDLRLVFVDGSHEYDDVKHDFCVWFGLLGMGGVIALHDSCFSWEGPTKVVQRFLLRNPFATHVGFVGSVTFCEKSKPSSFHRIRNTFLVLALRLLGKIAHLGGGRIAFWLGFLLNATDMKSTGAVFWIYWQTAKLKWNDKQKNSCFRMP